MWEHGREKERAVLRLSLRADGTCEYNGKACRADYAPFVALQALVVPIKARPRTSAPTAASLCAAFFSPPPPDRSNRPLFWQSQELATTHADKVRTCRLRHQPVWALWHSNCQTHAPRVQPGRCTARKGAPRMRHDRMRSAPFRRPCLRSEPHAPPLFPSRAARSRGASRPAAGCPCRFDTPRAARTRRRASPSRFAPRTCTPAPSHGPNYDARPTRPLS